MKFLEKKKKGNHGVKMLSNFILPPRFSENCPETFTSFQGNVLSTSCSWYRQTYWFHKHKDVWVSLVPLANIFYDRCNECAQLQAVYLVRFWNIRSTWMKNVCSRNDEKNVYGIIFGTVKLVNIEIHFNWHESKPTTAGVLWGETTHFFSPAPCKSEGCLILKRLGFI